MLLNGRRENHFLMVVLNSMQQFNVKNKEGDSMITYRDSRLEISRVGLENILFTIDVMYN
jgi:hypothetical protein